MTKRAACALGSAREDSATVASRSQRCADRGYERTSSAVTTWLFDSARSCAS
jgi:hypothetical protein